MVVKNIHLEVLKACNDVVMRQNDLLPHIAKKIEIEVNEILYGWALRKFSQSGTILNESWQYFFHGLECDVKNLLDGRFIRIDFGPYGKTNTFTSWGVLQFIMTSKYPWTEYEELKHYFATEEPPYNQFSGSLQKMNEIWEMLIQEKLIEKADNSLIEFQNKHASKSEDGITQINFPTAVSNKTTIDCSVANRFELSKREHSRKL